MKAQYLFDLNHPVVRDHTVYGQHLLPGLAYIDFIYQFFGAHGYAFAELELRDLTIYRPFIVREDSPLMCEVEATPGTAGVWQITIHAEGRPAGANTHKAKYASARMHRVPAKIFPDAIEPGQIPMSASTVTGLEEIYQRCLNRELMQTGFMKTEGAVYSSDKVMFADIRPSAEGLADAARLMFHPALMDAAAVCTAWAVGRFGNASAGLALPLLCRSFYASELIQRHCIIRARMELVNQKRDVRYMTIEFFTASGKKVAEIEGLASKLVREPGLIDPARTQTSVLRPIGQSLFTPGEFAGTRRSEAKHYIGAYEIETSLRELVSQRLKRPIGETDRHRGYYEMGLDSLALLELVHALESLLGVDLSPTLLFEYTTIAELASYLAETYGERPDRASDETGADHGITTGPVERDLNGECDATVRVDCADRAEKQSPEGGDSRDIAIIALAGRFPGARDLDEFWGNLQAAKDCITEVPEERWDHHLYFHPEKGRQDKACSKWGGFIDGVADFDPLFFSISPREAELMDPQVRLFLETVWNLLESAGCTRSRLRRVYQCSVGVYVGAMYQLYSAIETEAAAASVTALSSYGAIANRVSHWFDLRGPSLAIDTMCSSSMVALHTACKDLIAGQCRLAIVGGVNLSIHPKKYVGLSQLQLLASRPDQRSFADGDGFIPSEAVGAVLLKPLHHAIEDGDNILAVIKGTASNHGGHSTGFAVPSLDAQRQLIEDNLRAAGSDPRTISYVEAAAAGAALADAVEVAALQKAFCHGPAERQFCAIGSVKSNIGHAEAASGMAQLIKVVFQLRHAQLVPSIKTEPPNPHICFADTAFYLQKELAPWPRPCLTLDGSAREYPRRALINSFGAGGSNASAILEEYIGPAAEPDVPHAPGEGAQVMVFSARNPGRLQAVVGQMMNYLKKNEDTPLASVAYTLQCGREAMEARLAMVVADRWECICAMEAYLEGSVDTLSQLSTSLYSGRVGEDGSPTSELSLGTSGTKIVQVLLDPPDLKKLALIWAHGADVPWEKLHSGKNLRIVSLPTYPFERQRCWLRQAGPEPRRTVESETPSLFGSADPLFTAGSTAEPLRPSQAPGLRIFEASSPAATSPLRTFPKSTSELPRTDLERSILKIWEDVLGIKEVGTKNRFLDLGGNSFTGVQIISRIRELFQVDVPVAALLGPHVNVQTFAVAIVSALAQPQEAVSREGQLQPILQA
jgi:phthiocerol/phenolphthiocerol synthesis type-I polyketide synthase A